MIDKLVKRWGSIPPIVFDGILVFLIGLLTGLSLAFTNDDAYKYVNPFILFWMKAIIGSLAMALVGVQSFRSKVFGEHQKAVAAEAEKDKTDTTTKSTTTTEVATKPKDS